MVYSEAEITRLYRIRKTVMEMLRDRGYLVGDFEVNMSKHEFREKFGENMKREDLVINKTKKDKPSDQIYVLFPEEVKVGVNTLRTYARRMKSENVYKSILVCQSSLTNQAQNFILASRIHIEIFQVIHLSINSPFMPVVVVNG
jgi:DNA-directed RNA polymerase I, II, and III subunit RPABC1